MKNIIRCKRIISIVLMIILLFTVKVSAVTDKFNTTLKVSNTEVKRGGNVTVSIGLRDISIESGEKGIGAYTARIKFDSSVFEYVSASPTEKWEAPFYRNGIITGNTKDGEVVKTTQDIGTITFKVKDNAKLGETNIELINFSGSTAETDVSAPNRSTKIRILDNNTGNNTGNNSGNNQGTNNGNNSGSNAGNNSGTNTGNKPSNKPGNNSGSNTNTGSNTDNPNNDNPNDDNLNDDNNLDNNEVSTDEDTNTSESDESVTKEDKLPKTGISNYIFPIAIILCLLVAIIFLVRLIIINKKK